MSDQLLASISPTADGKFLASFLGGGARMRRPAIRVFDTVEAARVWIVAEAAAVSASVHWTPPSLADWIERRRAGD